MFDKQLSVYSFAVTAKLPIHDVGTTFNRIAPTEFLCLLDLLVSVILNLNVQLGRKLSSCLKALNANSI